MAGQLDASNQAIGDFAKEVTQKHSDLLNAIKALKTKEDQTTATWSGNARAAFDSFMERYYFQADKLNDKLLDTSEKLIKAGSKYEDQDTDFAQQVKTQVSSLDLPAL
ncbi:WXG100 family type VII secretion target [Nocardia thailandica]|uniref:WXG100 family type VII secretion target n=1 Tax=Nocardia thailandica TaxID=257275 RepID=A0ABW6PK14_9NOCA|nr:WXG100 family type VII secretion target [Nocardia thailandica]